MPKLGPGESLTSGGYVRRADGVVVISPEGKALMDAAKAAGSLKGMTMAEIAERVGNCDPIPAVTYSNGYSHSWSQPGYTFSVLFGHDNKAIALLANSEQLGGSPTPGLQARLSTQPHKTGVPKAGSVLPRARWLWLVAILIVVGVAGNALTGGDKKTPSTGGAPQSSGLSASQTYIRNHGADANQVAVNVATVQVGVSLLQGSPTAANVNQLAQFAQQAHDNLDALRNNFAESDSGTLGNAELEVFSGANDLKNAMGALEA
jgi:hypothetical protein